MPLPRLVVLSFSVLALTGALLPATGFAPPKGTAVIPRSLVPGPVTTFTIPVGNRTGNPYDDLRLAKFPSFTPTIPTITFPASISSFNTNPCFSGRQQPPGLAWWVFTPFNENKTIQLIGSSREFYPKKDYHPGEDWNLFSTSGRDDLGEPVFPIAAGIVIGVGKGDNGDTSANCDTTKIKASNSFGLTVAILHKFINPSLQEEFVVSVYSHLDSIEPTVNLGLVVTTDTRIGRVGTTGTDSPHLHWEIRKQTMLNVSDTAVSLKDEYSMDYWPASHSQDGGRSFIANNYYPPSCFIKNQTACFDFAVDRVEVDGNILNAGPADGTPEFVDDFADGSLTGSPTSQLSFNQGPLQTHEYDSFLHLTSLDGAYNFGASYRDDAILVPLFKSGGGDAVVTGVFRADIPNERTTYMLGFAGASNSNESVRISVTRDENLNVVVKADEFHTGQVLGTEQVSFDKNSDTKSAKTSDNDTPTIALRLRLNDGAGTVTTSYSTDGGKTFRALGNSSGSIFISGSQLFAFVLGLSVVLPGPTALSVVPATAEQLNLAWTDNATGETGFILERKIGANGVFQHLADLPSNTQSYGDFGLSAATEYCYRVRAFTLGERSPYSNESCATTPTGGGFDEVPP